MGPDLTGFVGLSLAHLPRTHGAADGPGAADE